MLRMIAFSAALAALAACTPASPDEPLEDLGAFELGHNIVLAPKVQKVPGSRSVTKEEWESLLTSEVAARFNQYEGGQLYHFGISVEGYFVAPPGVPLVVSPKSVLAVQITVWDDSTGRKLNEDPKLFTIFETATPESFVVGSGHARTREEQMLGLARNAVGEIEAWLVEQHETQGWFNAAPQAVSQDAGQGGAAALAAAG